MQKGLLMKITLMTINLRYGTANDGEYVWENRRHVMIDMLREYHPDIFGVQEGLRFHFPVYAEVEMPDEREKT
jgi:endonuclease/exonuclease/phosphatase family metal-dependent hydrolase